MEWILLEALVALVVAVGDRVVDDGAASASAPRDGTMRKRQRLNAACAAPTA